LYNTTIILSLPPKVKEIVNLCGRGGCEGGAKCEGRMETAGDGEAISESCPFAENP